MKAAVVLLGLLVTSASFANENFCRNPILKQSKERLSTEMLVEKVEIESVSMGENYQSVVLKAFSRDQSGQRVSELFDAKVDSDCKILELGAQPDSQRPE